MFNTNTKTTLSIDEKKELAFASNYFASESEEVRYAEKYFGGTTQHEHDAYFETSAWLDDGQDHVFASYALCSPSPRSSQQLAVPPCTDTEASFDGSLVLRNTTSTVTPSLGLGLLAPASPTISDTSSTDFVDDCIVIVDCTPTGTTQILDSPCHHYSAPSPTPEASQTQEDYENIVWTVECPLNEGGGSTSSSSSSDCDDYSWSSTTVNLGRPWFSP